MINTLQFFLTDPDPYTSMPEHIWIQPNFSLFAFEKMQYSGSATLWDGSGSLDPYIGLRILLFSSLAFVFWLFTVYITCIYISLQRYQVIKKLQNSWIQGFQFFCSLMKGSASGSWRPKHLRIQLRTRSTEYMCRTSVADPWLFGVDPDPDPRIHASY
jgi:hypothetical protein